MKRVLFLAYHFPPVGGAGVQRNSKFVRYLREFGYEPVVVTGPGIGADRWTPTDATLEGDLPPGTEVHRIETPDPARSGRWRGRAERWLGLETPWLSWWTENAVRIGCEVGGDCDLIYASLVPYEAATAAMVLSGKLGLPWVADLQDPWALDEMMVYPSRLHRRIGMHQMARALRSADAVVMNTPDSRKRVLHEFPDLDARRVHSVTNGFDAGDFAGPPPARDEERFRIVHTGYLHTELGLEHRRSRLLRRLLGGTMSGVDILTRSHLYLMEAVAQLRREDPAVAERVDIVLAGVLSAGDRHAGEASRAVQMLGYLPHDETVATMRGADLLFLPMQNIAPGARVGIVPGKTYEYMASGTPILAAVPDGDVREFLRDAGNAYICAPDDIAAMKNVIREQVWRKLSGEKPRAPRAEAIARFERRRLTEDLAAIFDRVATSNLRELKPRAATSHQEALA